MYEHISQWMAAHASDLAAQRNAAKARREADEIIADLNAGMVGRRAEPTIPAPDPNWNPE